jgi:LmbE family N-acetylglucosaminyl deacetylase/lysophospholipase L1-like esterase
MVRDAGVPPAAIDGNFTTREDTSYQGTLQASDPNGHALTYSVVANGAKGTAVVTDATTGAFVYTPNPDANGTDSFTFKANNGGLDSSPATVTVTITPVVDSIMVIAAHPDDESLMAAGVIKKALASGDSVKVVIVTNGDYTGTSVGLARELESKAALVDVLGVNENDIIFLGYPDQGLLAMMNDYPTNASGAYSSNAGRVSTYGNRGLGSSDYHTYRTGVSGGYNRESLVGDIRSLLDRYRPTQIFSHSPVDQHHGHRAAFYAVREAVVSLMRSQAQYRPTLYSAITHDGKDYPFIDKWVPFHDTPDPLDFSADANWPNPAYVGASGNVAAMRNRFTPSEAFAAPPNLGKSPYAWGERVSFPLPPEMRDSNLANNLKYRMIDGYASQRVTVGLIYGFGKNEEVFWKAPWGKNIAMIADVSASSENAANFQNAANVADSIPDGAPGNAQAEWVTQGEGVGAWVQMNWPASHVIDRVTLRDRPNLNDQILTGTLSFSDGSTLPVNSPLPNNGQLLTVMLGWPKTVTWVRFTVNSVSATTTNVGLSEMEVLEVPAPIANHQPFFTRGPTATDYSIVRGGSTDFSAPAYDADGDALSYVWNSQLGGTFTGSGATVTYHAPASASGQDIITVTVSDNVTEAVQASFRVNVVAPVNTNIAPWYSSITASSQNASTGQLASKAADGVVDGYPGDSTKEWATAGGKAGSWIRLDWAASYVVNKVVLHDRPNANDRVMTGTLLFSDGSSVAVGNLPNDGSALEVTFSARTINWVRFTVDTVSSKTGNVGLAEIEVIGSLPNSPPQISAGPAASPADIYENQTAQLTVTATDPEGSVLSYSWQPEAGSIGGAGSEVTFYPPAITSDAVVRVNVTVTDAGGLIATGHVDIMVRNIPNTPPQILAGPSASPQDIPETGTSQLTVSASDAEGGILTYAWAPESGSVTGSGSTVTFQPPPVSVDTTVRIHVTVTDPEGAAVSGYVDVMVRNIPNTPPEILSGPGASPADIGENQTAQLSVTASDPQGDVLTYSWVPTSGSISGSGATVTFLPPDVTADTMIRINLTVSDQGGLSATGYVDVMVRNVANTAPQITVGPAANPADIPENQTTQLSVTASDPQGDALTYAWIPQSGSITGSGPSVVFNPPDVSSDTVIRIDVIVTDTGGLSATGHVDVVVREALLNATNISGSASSVTASSEAPATGQLAVKAIDGVVDGYPGDYTKEWATSGGKAGSWIRLDWTLAYTINKVVLYDRKNTNDQVLSGTLLFSDGTKVAVGALPDSGSALTVSFAQRTVTWVRFTIDTVKSTTANVGLMEMEVYGVPSAQSVLYRESFDSAPSGWTVTDNASNHTPSTWGVSSGAYQESSGSRYSDSVGIFDQTAAGYEIGSYSLYNNFIHGDMDMRLQLRSGDIGVIGVMFGYQDDNNYYRFYMSKREGYRRLEKKVNGVFTPLASSTQSYVKNQWAGLRILFQHGQIIVFLDGDQVMAVSDATFSGGKLALWDGRNGTVSFDDLTALSASGQPLIGISSPAEYFVTPGAMLDISAQVINPETIGGVEFTVDEGTGTAVSYQDLVEPYNAQFNLLATGGHQVSAYLLNRSGQRLGATGTSDVLPVLGVNGYNIATFGDSITSGIGDNLASDDISLDGRVTGGGYEPVLDNQLTSYYGKPVLIATDGHPGDTSIQGLGKIATALTRNPASQAFLLLMGTNDALSSLPPPSGLGLHTGDAGYAGSYKETMQGLISAITGAGKKVYVAKVPPIIGNAAKNTVIQGFNQVINELVSENSGSGLVYAGPDLYTYFSANSGQIGSDKVHPTGAGYSAMGGLWKNTLVASPL